MYIFSGPINTELFFLQSYCSTLFIYSVQSSMETRVFLILNYNLMLRYFVP